jgi:hypothetical protein
VGVSFFGAVGWTAPLPVFLQLIIPKGFKSNLLELLIQKGLQAFFWKCGF